jgi:hypothetical protein
VRADYKNDDDEDGHPANNPDKHIDGNVFVPCLSNVKTRRVADKDKTKFDTRHATQHPHCAEPTSMCRRGLVSSTASSSHTSALQHRSLRDETQVYGKWLGRGKPIHKFIS